MTKARFSVPRLIVASPENDKFPGAPDFIFFDMSRWTSPMNADDSA